MRIKFTFLTMCLLLFTACACSDQQDGEKTIILQDNNFVYEKYLQVKSLEAEIYTLEDKLNPQSPNYDQENIQQNESDLDVFNNDLEELLSLISIELPNPPPPPPPCDSGIIYYCFDPGDTLKYLITDNYISAVTLSIYTPNEELIFETSFDGDGNTVMDYEDSLKAFNISLEYLDYNGEAILIVQKQDIEQTTTEYSLPVYFQ